MKIFIKYNENGDLPDIDDLVKKMWKENINVSKVADAVSFRDCTTLSLAWDKWLDDKRWASHPKFKEYIYFELIKESRFTSKIIMQIEDDAIEVDKCAFYKAVVLIGEKTRWEISADGIKWIKIDDYIKVVNRYLKLSFEEAVELSLLNYKY
ncbi:hypothetical protein [Clostridium saccharoperbutylacetonicum]|uniref:hypothetical protein n=1 Tax=Clostridium saccharoperbutylacetonicum TaxID=36745 RepID=UPI0039EB8C0F